MSNIIPRINEFYKTQSRRSCIKTGRWPSDGPRDLKPTFLIRSHSKSGRSSPIWHEVKACLHEMSTWSLLTFHNKLKFYWFKLKDFDLYIEFKKEVEAFVSTNQQIVFISPNLIFADHRREKDKLQVEDFNRFAIKIRQMKTKVLVTGTGKGFKIFSTKDF